MVIKSNRERRKTSSKSRRKPIDIIHDILVVAKNKPGIKKTRLMYKANLSHQALEKYLKKIENNGLLEISEDKYTVTEKGDEFLDEYDKMKDFLESFGLE